MAKLSTIKRSRLTVGERKQALDNGGVLIAEMEITSCDAHPMKVRVYASAKGIEIHEPFRPADTPRPFTVVISMGPPPGEGYGVKIP